MPVEFKKPLRAWQWFGVVVFTALFAAWLILYLASLDMSDVNGTTVSSPSIHEARVKIDFGDGHKRAFTGAVIEGMSAYHALLASTRAGNLDMEVESSSEGGFIGKIDAVSNGASAEWRYYLNGMPKDRYSLETQLVRPGDTIEFKYE